jgi:hypothetical protein
MPRKIEDLKDIKFGRLTAKEFVGIENHHAVWRCDCSCGSGVTVYAFANNLKNSKTQSCGCLKRELTGERMRERDKDNIKTVNNIIDGFKHKYNISETDWQLVLPSVKRLLLVNIV